MQITTPDIGVDDSSIVNASWVKDVAQPLDNNLTNLAAKISTGIMVQTGPETYTSRSLANETGTTVSNGNGVSANPSVNVTYEATASNIKMNGSQSVGSLNTAARGDHVHPSDTSRLAIGSGLSSGANVVFRQYNINNTYTNNVIYLEY